MRIIYYRRPRPGLITHPGKPRPVPSAELCPVRSRPKSPDFHILLITVHRRERLEVRRQPTAPPCMVYPYLESGPRSSRLPCAMVRSSEMGTLLSGRALTQGRHCLASTPPTGPGPRSALAGIHPLAGWTGWPWSRHLPGCPVSGRPGWFAWLAGSPAWLAWGRLAGLAWPGWPGWPGWPSLAGPAMPGCAWLARHGCIPPPAAQNHVIFHLLLITVPRREETGGPPTTHRPTVYGLPIPGVWAPELTPTARYSPEMACAGLGGGGPGTEAWATADEVWCADNRNEALTRAKLGEQIESPDCWQTPVAEHY